VFHRILINSYKNYEQRIVIVTFHNPHDVISTTDAKKTTPSNGGVVCCTIEVYTYDHAPLTLCNIISTLPLSSLIIGSLISLMMPSRFRARRWFWYRRISVPACSLPRSSLENSTQNSALVTGSFGSNTGLMSTPLDRYPISPN